MEQGIKELTVKQEIEMLRGIIDDHLKDDPRYLILETGPSPTGQGIRATAHLMGAYLAYFGDAETREEAQLLALIRLLEHLVLWDNAPERDERTDRSPRPPTGLPVPSSRLHPVQ